MRSALRGLLAVVTIALLAAAPAGAASLVDPGREAANLALSQGRQAQFGSPAFTARTAGAVAAYQRDRAAALARDPERAPDPNPCTLMVACPIDPRLTDPASHGVTSDPVLFTARSGATLSGHVWAGRQGPARRPGIVIVNGSIVGYEEAYAYAAQTLAQSGYVVLTFDAQGEGSSDQFGEGRDRGEGSFAGTPLLGTDLNHGTFTGLGGSGLPFYDGGQDALDFLLSTPAHPYTPVPSRTSNTSHAAKQRRRAAAGRNPAANPLWKLLDRDRIGIAGHSYGAVAASWLAQRDPRIKAAVAWDSLCVPAEARLDEVAGFLSDPTSAGANGPFGLPSRCFGAPEGPPPIAKPALGISGDYIIPGPHVVAPDPAAKQLASQAYTRAGVDSGQITIRGGTHLDMTDLPTGLIPATRRGIDLLSWYTTAWFDRYLKGDPTADRRLLTDRWRADGEAASADPRHDPDTFSYHYRSRLDIGRHAGRRVTCEDLRAGCGDLVAKADDCGPADYSFLAIATGQARSKTCNTAPVAKARARRLKGRAARYRLDARTSTDPDGAIAAYAWRIGGRTVSHRARLTRTLKARRRGSVAVRLTVTDDGGAKATRTLRLRPRRHR